MCHTTYETYILLSAYLFFFYNGFLTVIQRFCIEETYMTTVVYWKSDTRFSASGFFHKSVSPVPEYPIEPLKFLRKFANILKKG